MVLLEHESQSNRWSIWPGVLFAEHLCELGSNAAHISNCDKMSSLPDRVFLPGKNSRGPCAWAAGKGALEPLHATKSIELSAVQSPYSGQI